MMRSPFRKNELLAKRSSWIGLKTIGSTMKVEPFCQGVMKFLKGKASRRTDWSEYRVGADVMFAYSTWLDRSLLG
jgi:hypothetical protein